MLSLAFLALAMNPVAPESQATDPWTYAPVADGGFGWRHNSVKRESGAVTVEMLTYYGPADAQRKYSWRIQTVRFGCAERNYTTVQGTYLSPTGAPDGPVSPGMTWPVEDGTVENIVHLVLCYSANFTDGKVAPDRASAMKALAAK